MRVPDRFRVLCVDDSEDSCGMLKALLGFSGIDIISANTVKEAFQLAHDKHFDLYVLANRFQVGCGLELCRDLRSFDPQTPIVFYTGDASESDKQKGLAAGANAYLTKPDSDLVAETILNLIKQSRETAKPPFYEMFYNNAVQPSSNQSVGA